MNKRKKAILRTILIEIIGGRAALRIGMPYLDPAVAFHMTRKLNLFKMIPKEATK